MDGSCESLKSHSIAAASSLVLILKMIVDILKGPSPEPNARSRFKSSNTLPNADTSYPTQRSKDPRPEKLPYNFFLIQKCCNPTFTIIAGAGFGVHR